MEQFAQGRGTRAEVAAVNLHELGHNLGRGHMGVSGTYACPPPYLSGMSYIIQGGLVPGFPLDYSRWDQGLIDYEHLNETKGLPLAEYPTDDDIARGLLSWDLDGHDIPAFFIVGGPLPQREWQGGRENFGLPKAPQITPLQ